ncbi:hypothetical protein DL98DRAFT_533669 [Cadophora sp. DSE1049]|nr:hypothetical protein DL98DRAFT_533669 [Cadophora sp. DSE1049]
MVVGPREKETTSESDDEGPVRLETQVGPLRTKLTSFHTFVGMAVNSESRAMTKTILKRLNIGSATHTLHIQNVWDTDLWMSEASLLRAKGYFKNILSIVLEVEGLHRLEDTWGESSASRAKAGRILGIFENLEEIQLVLNPQRYSLVRPKSKPVKLMAGSFGFVIPNNMGDFKLWPSNNFRSYYRMAHSLSNFLRDEVLGTIRVKILQWKRREALTYRWDQGEDRSGRRQWALKPFVDTLAPPAPSAPSEAQPLPLIVSGRSQTLFPEV